MYEEIERKPFKSVQGNIKQQQKKVSTGCADYVHKDFAAVSLLKENKNLSHPVIQRKVNFLPNGARELVTDDEHAEKIAEVVGERSHYIHFDKMEYIKNEELKNIANANQGIIVSADYLEVLAGKQKARVEAANPDNLEDIENACRNWEVHVQNYDQVIEFLISIYTNTKNLGVIGSRAQEQLEERRNDLEKNNQDVYNKIIQYCGTDCVNATLFLLGNISGNEPIQLAGYCVEEIRKRIIEMIQEREFCHRESEKEENQKGIEDYTLERGKLIPAGLQGSDCGKFARNSAMNGLGNRQEYTAAQGITEYSFHQWLELMERRPELDGVATAETCAGQGGLFRTVFSIRPTQSPVAIAEDIASINRQGELIYSNDAIKLDDKKIEMEMNILRNIIRNKKGPIDRMLFGSLYNSILLYSISGRNKELQAEAKSLERQAVEFNRKSQKLFV